MLPFGLDDRKPARSRNHALPCSDRPDRLYCARHPGAIAMGLAVLILGLALFLGVHALTMARGARQRVVEWAGEGRYKIFYALVALFGAVLAWAVVDRISLKHRTDPGAPAIPVGGWKNDAIAVIAGTLAYLALGLVFHPVVIGVPVFGR